MIMEEIHIEVTVDFVEDLFRNSRKCRNYLLCTTTILELKHSVEKYLEKALIRGKMVSVIDAFESAVSDIIYMEDEWEQM